jgi:hypothetical protein
MIKYFVIAFLVVLVPMLLFVNYVMTPYLDEYQIWMNLYLDSGLIESYAKESFIFLENGDAELMTDEEISSKFFIVFTFIFYGTVIAHAIIIMLPIVYWLIVMPSVANKLARRLNCYPIRSLVIFKDGKECFKKKVKKIK